MSRWQPDARERLERAAMELFQERGFAETTVPDIAERAGLTTRTFFRHFTDKREVVFAGEVIGSLAERFLEEAPPGEPVATMFDGLRLVAQECFDGRRESVRLIRRLIETDAGLQERDLRKRAALAEIVRAGFQARGVPAASAALLGELGVALLHIAVGSWLEADDDRSLFAFVLDARSALSGMLSTA